MSALDNSPRPAVLERVLIGMVNDAAETDAQRWLRQNSAASGRAHAEMLADRARWDAEDAALSRRDAIEGDVR